MKKLVLIFAILMFAGAYGWESFMDKCIASWIGYPLDSVIQRWGYPDEEKNIAGRKLYIWVTYEETGEVTGGFTVTKTDKKGRDTVLNFGGVPEVEFCKKMLEVGDDNKVIRGEAKGNACPLFYLAGKKFVNPDNNQWKK